MSESTTVEAPTEQEELSHHPDPRTYVNVAVILAAITAAEVAVYYIDAVRSFLIPFLLAFAFVKFVMVALYFMHLKFDSRTFRRFFVTGLILSLAVFTIILTWFFAAGGAAPGVGT
jgi:cytochrome c oxidase subunit 4